MPISIHRDALTPAMKSAAAMIKIPTRLTLALTFIAGIILTLGYKDVYPELEQRFRRRRRHLQYSLDAIEEKGPTKHIQLEQALVPGLLPTESTVDLTKPTQDEGLSEQQAKLEKIISGSAVPDIKDGIEGTIGNTPLIRIKSLSDATGCDILAKAEFLNGAGNSPKDRVALSIIENAEKEGLLSPYSGDTIYEGTVGSTGISLAAICRARGYVAHICMPDDVAIEKSDLLSKLGAIVERVRPAPIVDQNHFVNLARTRAAEHTASATRPGRGFFADQFETTFNYIAHLNSTGPEIYRQTGGQLDAFVAGAGTGGTISGVALYLKPRLPNLKVVLSDPPGSGLYNRIKYGVMFDLKEREGTRRRHQVDTVIEGIGINRVTANFEAGRQLIDDAIRVTDDQAQKMARWLVEKDGMFVGSSSAVNCVAAYQTALELGPGHTVVTILCDSGMRHLSKFWATAGNVGGKNDVTLAEVLEP